MQLYGSPYRGAHIEKGKYRDEEFFHDSIVKRQNKSVITSLLSNFISYTGIKHPAR
jgi:hypothetical protein